MKDKQGKRLPSKALYVNWTTGYVEEHRLVIDTSAYVKRIQNSYDKYEGGFFFYPIGIYYIT